MVSPFLFKGHRLFTFEFVLSFFIESEGSFGHVSCPLELEAYWTAFESFELMLEGCSTSYFDFEFCTLKLVIECFLTISQIFPLFLIVPYACS